MGKIKQPTAIAKIKGTYQPCRYETGVDDQLNFIYKVIPTPPDHLSEIGQRYWIETLSQVQNINGYISFIDLGVFTVLCEVVDEMETTKKEIKTRYIQNKNGTETINPRVRQLERLRRQFVELCREFGFTPSSRSKIKIEPIQPPIKEEEFEL